MASYSKAIIVGYLGSDPSISKTNNGKKVSNFSVAVTQKRGDKEYTEWYKVTLWEKTAEIAERFLTKGSQVLVDGVLSVSTYEDKEGKSRYSLELNGNNLVLLGSSSKSSEENNENSTHTKVKEPVDAPVDNLPF